ncbi:MAG: DotI/IcmL/TraM family protein [Tatlockia sp.]|nr:DotI/IcmL/TraM family protein [Tatlockia sp.]
MTIKNYLALVLIGVSFSVHAARADETALAVWANEAIVATYSFDYKNFMQRQQEIAKYFTAKGWTDYSKVFLESKIPEAVQANSYFVSAVATHPPIIITKDSTHWQARMPLLVVYQNPQYQQKQTLEVTINFSEAPAGQGIRNFAITSLESKAIKPSCKCDIVQPLDSTAPIKIEQ